VEGTKGRGKKGAGLRSVRSRDPLIVAEGGMLVTLFLVILRGVLNKSKALPCFARLRALLFPFLIKASF
jgi:hypothetical protein